MWVPALNASAISRTWVATDACGNADHCEQTIIILDRTAPVLTCPADATVDCEDSTAPSNTGSGTASDNCDTSPLVTYSDVSVPGTCINQEVLARTWTALDACGNSAICTQFISRIDVTAPVISCPNDVTVECDASTDPLDTGEATASDRCDTDPSIEYLDEETAGSCLGELLIDRRWTATDACGHSSVCTQVITVIDSTPPVISCPWDMTVECDESTAPSAMGSATAIDSCDEGPSITMSDSAQSTGCAQESIISRTWTATDVCGNGVTCTQTIVVVDTTAPRHYLSG